MEGLLALVVVGIAAVAILGTWESEDKILRRLAKEHGLDHQGRSLRAPDWSATLVTVKSGKNNQTTWIDLDLKTGSPHALTLYCEGAGSGERAQAGQREHVTGDIDFDDLLWIYGGGESAARWLAVEGRRTLLLEAFAALPSARLEKGHLKCRSQFVGQNLDVMVEQAIKLARWLPSPPESLPRSRPRGWVNAAQRHEHASSAFAMAVLFLIPGVSFAAWWLLNGQSPWPHLREPAGVVGLVFSLLALAFALATIGLLARVPAAGPWLRGCLRAAQVLLCCGALGLVVVRDILVLVLGCGLAGFLVYVWERWRTALTRLRLSSF